MSSLSAQTSRSERPSFVSTRAPSREVSRQPDFDSGLTRRSYLPDLGRTSKDTLAKSLELEEATAALKAVRGASTSTGDERLMASQACAKAQEEFVRARSLNTSEISSTAVALGCAWSSSLSGPDVLTAASTQMLPESLSFSSSSYPSP